MKIKSIILLFAIGMMAFGNVGHSKSPPTKVEFVKSAFENHSVAITSFQDVNISEVAIQNESSDALKSVSEQALENNCNTRPEIIMAKKKQIFLSVKSKQQIKFRDTHRRLC